MNIIELIKKLIKRVKKDEKPQIKMLSQEQYEILCDLYKESFIDSGGSRITKAAPGDPLYARFTGELLAYE